MPVRLPAPPSMFQLCSILFHSKYDRGPLPTVVQGTLRRLPASALFDRQIVYHTPVTGNLTGGANRLL